jgi:hypothetical protein
MDQVRQDVSSGFDLVVVTDVQTPNLINYDIFKPKDSNYGNLITKLECIIININYNINKEAELFSIKQCDYVQENYKANSCFINMLVDSFPAHTHVRVYTTTCILSLTHTQTQTHTPTLFRRP